MGCREWYSAFDTSSSSKAQGGKVEGEGLWVRNLGRIKKNRRHEHINDFQGLGFFRPNEGLFRASTSRNISCGKDLRIMMFRISGSTKEVFPRKSKEFLRKLVTGPRVHVAIWYILCP